MFAGGRAAGGTRRRSKLASPRGRGSTSLEVAPVPGLLAGRRLRRLEPFPRALTHPARRATCPADVAGLIGLGDRKSIQPVAARAEGIGDHRPHHLIAAGA